jgi:basic membrane protein A
MKNLFSGLMSAGIILIFSFWLLPSSFALAQTNQGSPSSGITMFTTDDLPGFHIETTQAAGYSSMANRMTLALLTGPTYTGEFTIYRVDNLFRSEYVIAFINYPLDETSEIRFDALARDPQAILLALAETSRISGNLTNPTVLNLPVSAGSTALRISMELGQDTVASTIDFSWVRRGEVLQSIWLVYPAGDTPSANLLQLAQLVDQRVAERFHGVTFRKSDPLVPQLATHIPTPLDVSLQPGVIATNLFLAALMMLPFVVATDVFTSLSSENEKVWREKFFLTRWLAVLPAQLQRLLGWQTKGRAKGANLVRLVMIIFFYGLVFSFLDRGWNPFSPVGLILFINMTLAYGIVGLADDIVQWLTLKKWHKAADFNLRPTNFLIAAVSMLTSRLLTLTPGLMFGCPEALVMDEVHLGKKRHNHLLKLSAVTLLSIGLGLWVLTTLTELLQKQAVSPTLAVIIAEVEAFFLVVFAVALENAFVQMLGLPGSFGEALRKRSRWLWMLGLMAITFFFYHTLVNPRGELANALQEANVLIFIGATGFFALFTLGLWIYVKIRESRSALAQPPGSKRPKRKGLRQSLTGSVWLAISVIVLAVSGDILINRRNMEGSQVTSLITPTIGVSTGAETPVPTLTVSRSPQPFEYHGDTGKLCFVPAVNLGVNRNDDYLWNSVRLVAAQHGAQASYSVPANTQDEGYRRAIDLLAGEPCDLIIGNGFYQQQAFQQAAAEKPNQHFLLVGQGLNASRSLLLPNLWITDYKWPEAAFLAGYLAASVSHSGTVGTLGDVPISTVKSIMNCFVMGVEKYSATAPSAVSLLGWNGGMGSGSFANQDPNQVISLTQSLTSKGADVIFLVTDSTLMNDFGVDFESQLPPNVALIGIGVDWAWALPTLADKVITSVETRADQNIAQAVDAMIKGGDFGGIHPGTLVNGEIGFSSLRQFSDLGTNNLFAALYSLASSVPIKDCLIFPHLSGFLNLDDVDGENWRPSSPLTITILATPGGDPIYTGNATTDQNGDFYQDVDVDLLPGMSIEVSDGFDTASVTLTTLTVDRIDSDIDRVSGTAQPGAALQVIIGDGSNDYWASGVAGNDGYWEMNFAGLVDIRSNTTISVYVRDANQNSTIIK